MLKENIKNIIQSITNQNQSMQRLKLIIFAYYYWMTTLQF